MIPGTLTSCKGDHGAMTDRPPLRKLELTSLHLKICKRPKNRLQNLNSISLLVETLVYTTVVGPWPADNGRSAGAMKSCVISGPELPETPMFADCLPRCSLHFSSNSVRVLRTILFWFLQCNFKCSLGHDTACLGYHMLT